MPMVQGGTAFRSRIGRNRLPQDGCLAAGQASAASGVANDIAE